jgi:Protein of unknown function (DUF4232)
MSGRRVAPGAAVIVVACIGAAQGAGAAAQPAGAARTAAAPRCGTSKLRITAVLASPGLSHHGYVLRFQNRGNTCTLSGYPGVDGVSAQGNRLVSARRTKRGYLGGLKPGQAIPHVQLAHGKTGSALLEYIDGPVPGLVCPGVAALKVTPPNATASVRLSPAGLPSERLCRLQIHPVVAGGTGRGT